MVTPPFLAASSLADLGGALSSAAGVSLDLTPTHALASIRGSVALDLNRAAPWDLKADGGTAIRGESPIGAPGFVHHTMQTKWHDPTRWVAQSAAAFNFASQPWAVLFPWRVDVQGAGDLIMGNLKGPRHDDPWYQPAQGVADYGADRGWGVSSNGSPNGGFGFMQYGSAGWHNVDTTAATSGLYDNSDGKWRVAMIGCVPDLGLSWLCVARRISEGGGVVPVTYQGAPGAPGDITSPDGLFVIGSHYWGVNLAGQTGAIGLPLVAFEHGAAVNCHTARVALLTGLQRQLEESGG